MCCLKNQHCRVRGECRWKRCLAHTGRTAWCNVSLRRCSGTESAEMNQNCRISPLRPPTAHDAPWHGSCFCKSSSWERVGVSSTGGRSWFQNTVCTVTVLSVWWIFACPRGAFVWLQKSSVSQNCPATATHLSIATNNREQWPHLQTQPKTHYDIQTTEIFLWHPIYLLQALLYFRSDVISKCATYYVAHLL